MSPTGDLAAAIVEQLAEHGVVAHATDQPADDCRTLVALDAMPPFVDRTDATRRNHNLFRRVRNFGTADDASQRNLVMVCDTRAPQGGWASGASALGRTAALEWPQCTVRVIDTSTGNVDVSDTARAVAQELASGGATPWVRLRNGERTAREAIACPADPLAPSPLSEGDVIVVSGGAKGVTATCLQALAKRAPYRFVLLGRSPLTDEPEWAADSASERELQRAFLEHTIAQGNKPNPKDARAAVRAIRSSREIRDTLSALRANGSGASYHAVDVCDRPALDACLAEVRERWGGIDVLVHAAGVLADKHIVDKTDEQFARVFDTKILGLQALWDAVAQDDLKAVLLFSSVAASSGNVGQADYAMANEVLEGMAREWSSERPDTLFRAIGWGPWNGGMVTPELARNFEARGVPLIELDAGAGAFVDEFCSGASHPAVVVGGSPDESGLMGTTVERSTRLALQVSTSRQPWLADHNVQGRPIVPIAMAMEWMTRAVSHLLAHETSIRVRDLRVLRPVPLDATGEDTELEITIEDSEDAPGSYTCTLFGPDGRPSFRGVFAESTTDGPLFPPGSGASGETVDPVPYGGKVLFHGPAFHVLEHGATVGMEGAQAPVRTTSAKGWEDTQWCTDPAAVDGALQLALLWAEKALGGPSLPMGFGRYVGLQRTTAQELRVVLSGQPTGTQTGRVDATFLDREDRVVAQLQGVDLVRVPEPGTASDGVSR